MICEICGKEHDGTYGSGRFCSNRCRYVYIGRQTKRHVNNLPLNKKTKDGGWKCLYCDQVFKTRSSKQAHVKEAHPDRLGKMWNAGLTKKDNKSLLQASKTMQANIETGKIKPYFLGKNLSNAHKASISASMKVAHSQGRAHNIGSSRWNNEPSYPELWFMRVIQQEFDDKDYVREYPFSKYSLDFAWVTKKKCIEIDGEQHQRFKEQKERDINKDTLLLKKGWKVLRLPWKLVFSNPKEYIEKAKKFIHE